MTGRALVASPQRVAALPIRVVVGAGTLVRALLQIPANVATMAEATRVLPDIERRMAAIEADTTFLARIEQELDKLSTDFTEVARAMPAVLDLRTLLEDLPDTMVRLDATTQALASDLGPLQEAAVRMADIAGRIPGMRRRRPNEPE